MANNISRPIAWGNIYEDFSRTGILIDQLSTYYDVSWTYGENVRPHAG